METVIRKTCWNDVSDGVLSFDLPQDDGEVRNRGRKKTKESTSNAWLPDYFCHATHGDNHVTVTTMSQQVETSFANNGAHHSHTSIHKTNWSWRFIQSNSWTVIDC